MDVIIKEMAQFQLIVSCRTDSSKEFIEQFDRSKAEHAILQKIVIDTKLTYLVQKQTNFKIETQSKGERKPAENILFKVSSNTNSALLEATGHPIYEIVGGDQLHQHKRLKCGDVYKLGNKKLTVLHIGSYDIIPQVPDHQYPTDNLNPENQHQGLKCFSCPDTRNRDDNPLKMYCKCNSNDLYIHQRCLFSLLKSRTNPSMTKEGQNCRIPKRTLQCSQCNHYYSLPEITKTLLDKQPHEVIVLEDSQIFYCLPSVSTDSISLGREKNTKTSSYITLNSQAVSRWHSQIFYNQEKRGFYIKDCGSKFGTLKQIKRCEVVDRKEIQIGKNIFSLKREQKPVGFFHSLMMFCQPGRKEEKNQRRC